MSLRRVKTYTGEQGHVYQYYFVGKRPALPESRLGDATEYVFDVISDRKSTFAVSVFLTAQTLDKWALQHGRCLSGAEQYAMAKLRLFQAFDETEVMAEEGRTLQVDFVKLEGYLATLGISS